MILKHIKFFVYRFFDKELTLFAASLSFYTIFTIIPLLLMMLTLLTSMESFSEYYESIKSFLFSNLMPGNSKLIMGYIDGFLENSAKIGTLGLAMILISSLLFFRNFAYIANKIFHAKKRSFLASVSIYFILLLLAPVALGISFYITGYIASLMASNSLTEGLNILPLIPYLIVWAFFFLVFQLAANIKVNVKASLISSFIIAVIFSLSKNAFIYYIMMNKLYTTMYGSFAIVMFLFLWIYISWVIFIYGLKLCYMIHSIYKKREAREEQ